jgi:hypothetical protein
LNYKRGHEYDKNYVFHTIKNDELSIISPFYDASSDCIKVPFTFDLEIDISIKDKDENQCKYEYDVFLLF